MIRERRVQDLDRLGAVLAALPESASTLDGTTARDWLTEHDAEQSWVFDSAPLTVAPTKNVVGHVQMYTPADRVWTPAVVDLTGRSAGELLAISKLFVKPSGHDYGIARFLFKESVRYIQSHGKLAVLDLAESPFLSRDFCRKFGFGDLPGARPDAGLMVYTG